MTFPSQKGEIGKERRHESQTVKSIQLKARVILLSHFSSPGTLWWWATFQTTEASALHGPCHPGCQPTPGTCRKWWPPHLHSLARCRGAEGGHPFPGPWINQENTDGSSQALGTALPPLSESWSSVERCCFPSLSQDVPDTGQGPGIYMLSQASGVILVLDALILFMFLLDC